MRLTLRRKRPSELGGPFLGSLLGLQKEWRAHFVKSVQAP